MSPDSPDFHNFPEDKRNEDEFRVGDDGIPLDPSTLVNEESNLPPVQLPTEDSAGIPLAVPVEVPPQATPETGQVSIDQLVKKYLASNETGQRLHITSLVFELISRVRALIFPLLLGLFGAASGNMFWTIIAGISLIPAMFIAVVRYFTLRYRIQDNRLVVTRGLLFRNVTTVPIERIQNIDLVQNVLHRIFKVAEVRVETASGTEPEATLRVLGLEEIRLLQAALRELKALDEPDSRELVGQITDERDLPGVDNSMGPLSSIQSGTGESLLRIPVLWLVKAGLASNRGMIIIGVLAGLSYQFEMWERLDFKMLQSLIPDWDLTTTLIVSTIVGLVALAFLRLFGVVWYLLRFYQYELFRDGDDLRIECGMLTRVSATIPRRRIQFISVHRTLLMRWMGLASVRLETAGGAGKENEDASTTISRRWFIPVLKEARVREILEQLRTGLNWDLDQLEWKPLAARAKWRLSRLAILGCLLLSAIGLLITRPWGWIGGAVLLPFAIIWVIGRSRSMKYARTPIGTIYRSGVFNRITSVTFYDKIQTLGVRQSPFDRRWKMATLTVDTAAAGPAGHRIQVPLLDETFAREEFQRLSQMCSQYDPFSTFPSK